MSKTRALEIRTVIVSGKRGLFKAALSRSILGVTFKKFKRKKQEFYKHRAHNEAVTESVFNWLYEYLLTRLRNLSDLEIKTYLKLIWDENGKILAVSDITVPIYMKVGELKVNELQVREKFKNIKIDLFYSDIDARSKKLRSDLPQLIESLGKENFDYSEHNFLTPVGKEMAQAYKIETVPTVMINAETKLVDPPEQKLRQEIEKAFAPVVEPSTDPQFSFDPQMKPNVELLAELKV
ncbi:MAG: hypothetical protein ACE5KD_04360 [Candidatus Bathyarchaeia archaeon]